MHFKKGFIGLGVLIAIVLAVIVVGGGAYYVMHQTPAPTQPIPADTSTTQQTSPQQTTNTSVQVAKNTTASTPATNPTSGTPSGSTATQSNNSKGFLISGSGSQFALSVGQSITDTQDGGTLVLTLNSISANSANITFTDTEHCDTVSNTCPSNGIITKSVTATPALNQPAYSVLALGTPITFTLTSLTQNGATIAVVKPSGTIDRSSLTQTAGKITLTGSAIGVNGVLVSLSQGALPQDFNTGYVPAKLTNGKWSVDFNNIPAGTYSVYNLDAEEVANLGGGTLIVTK